MPASSINSSRFKNLHWGSLGGLILRTGIDTFFVLVTIPPTHRFHRLLWHQLGILAQVYVVALDVAACSGFRRAALLQ
jgi:hypothetical protein